MGGPVVFRLWLALLRVILDLGPDFVARCLKVDIYPTLVALHGDTPDIELQGRSFIPLLTASGATDPQAPTMIWFSGAFWNSVLCLMMLLNAVFRWFSCVDLCWTVHFWS